MSQSSQTLSRCNNLPIQYSYSKRSMRLGGETDHGIRRPQAYWIAQNTTVARIGFLRPLGAWLLPLLPSHDLRRGLHFFAASRLGRFVIKRSSAHSPRAFAWRINIPADFKGDSRRVEATKNAAGTGRASFYSLYLLSQAGGGTCNTISGNIFPVGRMGCGKSGALRGLTRFWIWRVLGRKVA